MNVSQSALKIRDTVFIWGARVYIMGIINVTPDSFSDGGLTYSPEQALRQAETFVEQGADILDLGGESSRPYARSISPEEEINRVIPAIKAIRKSLNCPISIDTRKSVVAEAALDEGADIINDISALTYDPEMKKVAATWNVPVILMHMKGSPEDMQNSPAYLDVIGEVNEYLDQRIKDALDAGISKEKIILDPGIGFGKRLEDNINIVKGIEKFKKHKVPVLTGVSRKAFIGAITNIKEPENRDNGTLGAIAASVFNGTDIVRVHNVAAVAEALKVLEACVKKEIK